MDEPGAGDPVFDKPIPEYWVAARERLTEQQAAEGPRIPSPGGWMAPEGVSPGADWLPRNADAVRTWKLPILARIWARTPWRRSAYVWMWHHGYFLVLPARPKVPPPSDPPPADGTGVREPHRPIAPASAGAIALEPEQEQGGLPD